MEKYSFKILSLLIGLIVVTAILSISFSFRIKTTKDSYLNAELNSEQRAMNLMKKMTLEEKVAQMCQYVGIDHIKKSETKVKKENLGSNDAFAFYPGLTTDSIRERTKKGLIGSFLHVTTAKEANELQALAMQSRLKIPLIIGIDAIHGNALYKGATVYPTPISMAATWDDELVYESSKQTAKEMRAMGAHWAFTPNVDLARDQRWGRVGETFGEDPHLVGNLGVAMIKAMQEGSGNSGEKVIACAKHLIGGGESMNGINAAPTDISERTLRELHLPPFKRAIQEAKVFSIMTAHNELNGVPCHANKQLMTDICREEYGFEGFFVSDWLDIERLAFLHHIARDNKEASMLSVNAGMDMHMHGPQFLEDVVALVKEGKISEERINTACKMILMAKFDMGLFENPYVDEDELDKKVYTPEHQKTALEMARKSIVLLKNDGLLPIKKGQFKNIFVVGPNSNNQTILGDWHWKQPEDRVTTVLEGFQQVAEKYDATILHYDVGENLKNLKDEKIKEAVMLAEDQDLVIAVVGENALRYKWSQKTSGENIDRAELGLPGKQMVLLQQLKSTGVPMIVVLVNGRPVSEPWISEQVPAVIEGWEPGSLGGQAIAEVVFGEVNPSGKLPVTLPRSVGQLQMVYNHKPSAYFHHYAFEKLTPLYPFGYGLSYSDFEYSEPTLSSNEMNQSNVITVTLSVTNTSDMDGEEVVQMYIRDKVSSVTRLVKELKGYQRIFVKAGEQKEVKFEVQPEDLAFYNLDMEYVIEEGEFEIMTGSSSDDKDLQKVILKVASSRSL